MKAFFAPAAVAAAVLLASPAVAILAPAAAWAETAHVGIKDFMFTPMTLTVPQGATVQWINLDDVPHTVVEKDKKWRSAALDTNDTYSHTFDQPGTYEYYCTLHPKMVAKVIVTPAKPGAK